VISGVTGLLAPVSPVIHAITCDLDEDCTCRYGVAA
jgi:hypothetical protein